ncbi:MAG: MSMEG_4193 family putative phosphomutase [Nocardioidaceae bacterium]
MATVLLVRHGRSSANHDGLLAGRTPGVLLDEVGRQQAAGLAARLAELPIASVVSSPLERCQLTGEAIVAALKKPVDLLTDGRLTECGYGDWTGQALKKLAKEPLWKIVQAHPSAATFPSGESLREMQGRAVDAIRDIDAQVTLAKGVDALWIAVSHGDVIKAILADAVGTHLDHFQRLVVDPASVSVISYTPLRPFVLRVNEHGDLAGLTPRRKSRRRTRTTSDAAVGGGAGA